MRKPYFKVSAQCRNTKCDMGEFTLPRKQIVRKGSNGRPYQTANLVCPRCRTWADVTRIEKVA